MYKIFEKLAQTRGVTAYFVSKETGVALPTFYAWRDGKYHPKDDKLEKVADFFGVPLAYLKGLQEAIQCPDCHMGYNPIDEASYAQHKAYHDRFLAIQKHYHVTIPSREEAEQRRMNALLILRDIKYDKFRRISAFDTYAKFDFLLHLYDTGFTSEGDIDAHMKELAEKLRPDRSISLDLCNAIRAEFGIEEYREEMMITDREYRLICKYRELLDESKKLVDRMLGLEEDER